MACDAEGVPTAAVFYRISQQDDMDTSTLLIIIIVALIVLGEVGTVADAGTDHSGSATHAFSTAASSVTLGLRPTHTGEEHGRQKGRYEQYRASGGR